MLSQPRRRLTLPVEILNREFDAKVLLACFAAERGFAVIIGSKREIHLKVGSLPRSIYLAINLSDRNITIDELLNKLGHTIAGGDEEGVVYTAPEVYIKEKVGPVVFKKPDIFFAWGPENAHNWEHYSEYNGAPIHITGNPRIDLLRPELRPFWSDQIRDIRDRFGHFVLINSNFQKLNHYRQGKGIERQTLENAKIHPASVDASELGLANHRYALFQRFKEMAAAVAQAHPDRSIIIRPQPSENKETWRQATTGCSNVHVIFEGTVVPWLLAADVVIHNSCTTGMESYLLDVPVVAYRPVTSEHFDKKLPNSLSHQAFNLEELQTLIESLINDKLSPDPDVVRAQKQLLARHLAAVDGTLAAERIVAVLEQFDDELTHKPTPRISTYLMGKLQAATRRYKREYNAHFHRKRANRSERFRYLRHIFPEIELSEVESRIDRLRQALNRFSEVKVQQVDHGIFEVTS